jgi:hypothetical protein
MMGYAGKVVQIVGGIASIECGLREKMPRMVWIDSLCKGDVAMTAEALGIVGPVDSFAAQLVVHLSISNNKGKGELEIDVVNLPSVSEVVPA